MRNKRILTLIFVVVSVTLLVGCLTTPPINQVPVITSTPVKTAKVGSVYIYDVNATDPDDDTLNYFLITKPDGMSIDSANGLIIWTPVLAQIGDNPVTVGVSDNDLSVTQDFTIKVSRQVTPPYMVEKEIIISWLEDAIRYYPDGTFWQGWIDDPLGPATLLLTYGRYHFVNVNDFYNTLLPDIEGSINISGIGKLSGDTTYTSLVSFLPIKEHIEGEVEIIIYKDDESGTMVGTYTQWAYAFGDEAEVKAEYPNAVVDPEQEEGWWFIGYTEYDAHE